MTLENYFPKDKKYISISQYNKLANFYVENISSLSETKYNE